MGGAIPLLPLLAFRACFRANFLNLLLYSPLQGPDNFSNKSFSLSTHLFALLMRPVT
jgi:hypothetical protein